MRVLGYKCIVALLVCFILRTDSSYVIDFLKPVQNDDFCDLKNGVDESATSACSHLSTRFACPAASEVVVTIPSSRVNDGVCDCCDGSDERNNMENKNNPATGLPYPSLANSWDVQCPNTCGNGVVSPHHDTVKVKETVQKSLKSVVDNKLWLEKKSRKERFAANQEKRKQNPELETNTRRKPLYERVKTRLYVSLLVFALCLVLCLPVCYCLCCVPAGFYKFRMFLLYVSQKLGLSSVKTSYTLSKDAIDMV